MMTSINSTKMSLSLTKSSITDTASHIENMDLKTLRDETDTLISRVSFGVIVFSVALMSIFLMFSLIGFVLFSE